LVHILGLNNCQDSNVKNMAWVNQILGIPVDITKYIVVLYISYARQAVKFIADFVGNYSNNITWRLLSNLNKSKKMRLGSLKSCLDS